MEAMKVKYFVNDWTGLPVSYCPSCNKCVDMYLYGRESKEDIVNFCPFCGQHLDWTEDNDTEE